MKRIYRYSVVIAVSLTAMGVNTPFALAAGNDEPPPAPPQTPNGSPATKPKEEKKRSIRFRIIPTARVFLPQSQELRQSFGETWVSYGLNFRGLDVPQAKPQLDFQPEFISSSGHGNKITLVMPQLRYRMALSDAPIRPYLALLSGPVLAETRVTDQNLPSRWRGGFGVGLQGGVAFTDRGTLTLGYQWTNTIRGFDLSGAKAGFAYRF